MSRSRARSIARQRCGVLTKAKKPCRTLVISGRCWIHGGGLVSSKGAYAYGCCRCLTCNDLVEFHDHHILRYADGGPSTPDNLIILCRWCHEEWHRWFEPLDNSKLQTEFEKWVNTPPLWFWMKLISLDEGESPLTGILDEWKKMKLNTIQKRILEQVRDATRQE